jgi:hypothetical protein
MSFRGYDERVLSTFTFTFTLTFTLTLT